jgi:hypothetical protein
MELFSNLDYKTVCEGLTITIEPVPTPTPIATNIPTPTPIATRTPSSQSSTSTSTSQTGIPFVISSSILLSLPLVVTNFVQNAGTVLTLSGQTSSGVAITGQSVSIAGDLVLDLSGVDVYNGMTITLINATNITGQWDGVSVFETSDCVEYQVDITYTQQLATATTTVVSHCSSASKFIVCVAFL